VTQPDRRTESNQVKPRDQPHVVADSCRSLWASGALREIGSYKLIVNLIDKKSISLSHIQVLVGFLSEKVGMKLDADQLKKLNALIWNNYGNLNTNYIFE